MTAPPLSLDSFLQQGDTPNLRAGETAKTFQRRRSSINLKKSIQLLDDALSGSLIGSPPTSVSLRQSWHHLDKSSTRGFPSPRHVSSHFHTQNLLVQDKSVMNLSGAGDNDTTFRFDQTEEVTSLRMTFIADEDPGRAASSGLFESFKDVLQHHQAPHQIMELLSEYETVCSQQVASLKKLSKSVTRSQTKLQRTTSTSDLLQHEKNTWKLFQSLFKDRLETEAREDLPEAHNSLFDDSLKAGVWCLSEQNIANFYLAKDSQCRESQLVVDWLETCAAENLDSYFENVKFFVDQPVAWENTLHHLQKLKQGVRSSADKHVSEMDPDAPHRQKRCLDDLDQEDDRFFTQHLYICLRAGQLGKAQELCQACGQPWRAATLEGWRLLHDANLYSGSSLDVAQLEGNPFRDVWKAVCWRMSTEQYFDSYEKAVYGALSGNLPALLPVCSSWLDSVWAYYKVMVDIKVEQEIRNHTERTLTSLPSEYWDQLLEPDEIFKKIAASVNETVRLQSEHWYHIIQKCVILGSIPDLIEVMYTWVQNGADTIPGHLLRFMAHIVLFLRTIGQSCKEELSDCIIEAYVKYLIRDKHRSLVAFYVATLKPAAQVQWYATFLEDIETQKEQQQCLKWAEEEGLDVALITRTVVEHIRARGSSSSLPENSLVQDMTVTEEDMAKINAIDWLVFNRAHRSEALKQANAIMRSFIIVKKHAAAQQVFDKLPLDSLDVINREWHAKTGSSELAASDDNAIREYMCLKAYLDAVDSFNNWFSLYHQGQPAKPPQLVGGSFTDRVALEHATKQYQNEYQRWRRNLLIQAQTTRDRIYNVLLFADGGWMVDTAEVADEPRKHQLSQLRKLHLPSLCLNLHTVLHDSEMYVEALQIADVVASEQHQLYKEFSEESMQHLLLQLTRSSHCLLNLNKDPLGYELI